MKNVVLAGGMSSQLFLREALGLAEQFTLTAKRQHDPEMTEVADVK